MELLKDLGLELPNPSSKQKQHYGLFVCSCGNEVRTQIRYVLTGKSTKCKSCSTKQKRTTHGLEKHPLYGRWMSMKQRCYNPSNRDYHKYGAKGVTVCEEWRTDFYSFYTWCINNGYKEELALDKDIKCNQLNISPAIYSPDTCTFVTTRRNSQEVSGIKVVQKTLEGVVVNEFNSYSDAARSLEQSNRKQIKKCCIGTAQSAAGFLWEHKQ